MRVSSSLPFLLVLLALFPLGCGTRESRTPVHPARGQVLYNGKPVPHALVVFHPIGGRDSTIPQPRGRVQDDGTFVLETFGTHDGAPAGEYAVTVEWWLSNAKRPELPPANKLPQRFSQPRSSGLRARVEPGENQLPTIRLSH